MQENYKTNAKAIVSLILSILSILCCCVWYVGFVLGVVAVILGILAVRGENPRQKDAGIAGIVVGAAVDILWLVLLSQTGIYEIIPGFILGGLAAIVVTLLDKKPSAEIEALYDLATGSAMEK